MDNRNIFNTQQQQFYPYGYNAVSPAQFRPELAAYMMPQNATFALIKGRPVSSFEEARVAQIDLDGSTFIFPDLGNKKIYTKRINADGTATIQSFILQENASEEKPNLAFATKDEVENLRGTLEEILSKLNVPKTDVKTNF